MLAEFDWDGQPTKSENIKGVRVVPFCRCFVNRSAEEVANLKNLSWYYDEYRVMPTEEAEARIQTHYLFHKQNNFQRNRDYMP